MGLSPGSSLGSSLARGHRVVLWARLFHSASLHRSIELVSGEVNSGGGGRVILRWTRFLPWGEGGGVETLVVASWYRSRISTVLSGT